MTDHTPTPWEVISGDDYYIAADGYPSEFVGHFKGDDTGDYLAFIGNRPADFGAANAAFIVKSVNCHDALVEALATIADIAEGSGTLNSFPNISKIARGALASVGRQT